MTDRITAQEAFSIASVDYERQMNNRVVEHLATIYARIRNASQNGKMTASVPITISVNEYRDKLSDHLKQDGFKCSYNYDDFSGEDYITISWNHQK